MQQLLQNTGEPKFWWVNNKQTYKHEIGGNYLWSPVTNANGQRNQFYENMKRVQVGDIVFAFANGQIRAIGICSAPAILMPLPSDFGSTGHSWGS